MPSNGFTTAPTWREETDAAPTIHPDVRALGRALALSRRPHLYLVEASSPETVDAALGRLSTSLGSSVAWDRFRWPSDSAQGISLVDAFEPWLGSVAAERSAGKRIVHVVDLTAVGVRELGEVFTLLVRWNERRDAIFASFSGPVVVMLPPAVFPLIVRFAPDLWSVRSGEYSLGAPAAEPELPANSLQNPRPARIDQDSLTSSIAALRVELEQSPGNRSARLDLANRLTTLASERLTQDRVGDALALTAEVNALTDVLSDGDQSAEVWHARAMALDVTAAAEREAGQHVEARETYHHAIRAARQALSLASEERREDCVETLAFLLGRHAHAAYSMDHVDESLASAREAAALAESLMKGRHRHAARSIASSAYSAASTVHRINGNLIEARKAVDAAIAIARAALSESAGDFQWLRDLAIGLAQRARIAMDAGDLVSAESDLLDSHALRQRVAEVQPVQPDALRQLGVTWSWLANLHARQGRLVQAFDEATEALSLSIKVEKLAPEVVQHRLDVANSHAELARLSERAGALTRSIDHWFSALSALGRCLGGPGESVGEQLGRVAAEPWMYGWYQLASETSEALQRLGLVPSLDSVLRDEDGAIRRTRPRPRRSLPPR